MEFEIGKKYFDKNYEKWYEFIGWGRGLDRLYFKDEEELIVYMSVDYARSQLVEKQENSPQEFKVGDRVVVNDKGAIEGFYIIKNGEEVEVVGINSIGKIMVRNKNNICVSFAPESLKPLPSTLKEGQEVWVKTTVSDPTIDAGGDIMITRLCNFDSPTGNYFCDIKRVYIKNDQGQIVPYKQE